MPALLYMTKNPVFLEDEEKRERRTGAVFAVFGLSDPFAVDVVYHSNF